MMTGQNRYAALEQDIHTLEAHYYRYDLDHRKHRPWGYLWASRGWEKRVSQDIVSLTEGCRRGQRLDKELLHQLSLTLLRLTKSTPSRRVALLLEALAQSADPADPLLDLTLANESDAVHFLRNHPDESKVLFLNQADGRIYCAGRREPPYALSAAELMDAIVRYQSDHEAAAPRQDNASAPAAAPSPSADTADRSRGRVDSVGSTLPYKIKEMPQPIVLAYELVTQPRCSDERLFDYFTEHPFPYRPLLEEYDAERCAYVTTELFADFRGGQSFEEYLRKQLARVMSRWHDQGQRSAILAVLVKNHMVSDGILQHIFTDKNIRGDSELFFDKKGRPTPLFQLLKKERKHFLHWHFPASSASTFGGVKHIGWA